MRGPVLGRVMLVLVVIVFFSRGLVITMSYASYLMIRRGMAGLTGPDLASVDRTLDTTPDRTPGGPPTIPESARGSQRTALQASGAVLQRR